MDEGSFGVLEEGSFEQMLDALRSGEALAVSRSSWNGPNQSVRLQRPDKHSKMTEKYLYLCKPDGTQVPWVPSQGDLFALDWFILAYGG
jgi:hypothetical protein